MGDFADRLVPAPAIELLGTAIPVSDDVIHVADENRVVGKIEQPSPFTQRHVGRLIFQSE